MKNKKRKQEARDREVVVELLNTADKLQKDLTTLLNDISSFKSDAKSILMCLNLQKEEIDKGKDEFDNDSLGFATYG